MYPMLLIYVVHLLIPYVLFLSTIGMLMTELLFPSALPMGRADKL